MVACRMEDTVQHQPVLLAEVLDNLAIKADGVYVDATFGRGGHAQEILKQLGPQGRLLAMDKDPEAIAHAQQRFAGDKRFSIQHSSFAQIENFLKNQDLFGKVDGILLDLGVSSPQLDDPERGFSFLRSGKLDMRMDSSHGIDAATWLANISEQELAKVLWEYGEERFSRRIARAIVTARQATPIATTTELAEIVAAANPAWEKGKNPATRSFQAIRIAINQELDDLKSGLNQSLESLKVGGRLLVISFHSLEDRIVKHFIQDHERGEQHPVGMPIKHENIRPRMKRLGRAIKPSAQEVAINPRARSAVLRIAEKLL
ncbi:MAG: 16S rRNA (cytosine(1402)-N(4))-methyltransferase RsmH [Gammaproteobacteria bacterium]